MLLTQSSSGHLVEVLDLKNLFDPYDDSVLGRLNIGEELPEPEKFAKANLIFPSGENLPRCWIDPHYRDDEVARHRT